MEVWGDREYYFYNQYLETLIYRFCTTCPKYGKSAA
jgi:hypothetical protein